MSAGGSFAPSANPSGGPIDNQQRLQTSPNPSLPPADYSMGYARNFQPPSFFNPFSGYYGANTGMGGFQPQFGGFQTQFGGFGGFGGFQQPQYGGFQQPFGGGFQQDGFGGQFNRFTRRGQEYTQPYMPQPMPQPEMRFTTDHQYRPEPPSRPQPPPGYHYELGGSGPILTADSLTNAPPPVAQELATRQMPQQGGSLFSLFASTQPTTPYSTFNQNANETDEERRIRVNNATFGPLQNRVSMGAPRGTGGITANMGGMGNFGGFNPMMGGGIGAFGGRGFMGYR